MASQSPRRSSRARAAQPRSQQSSSSVTSSRLERNTTRYLHRPSSDKSTPSVSLSSEPPEDLDDGRMSRRRRRGFDEDQETLLQDDALDGLANASDDVHDEEEDEAVRCICGSDDYPGRPLVDGPDAELFATVDLTAEDVTGFFVQCDVCKVWQHGACVGIFSAESSPDEYFCEQCRHDLHKINTANNGQKYSKYLPLHQPSHPSSRAASIVKESVKSPMLANKSSRTEQALQASKRRSTMNSRDAAYDDEQLLRAIEASREDAPQENSETGNRRGKRGRSGSEENQVNAKRQRTASRSTSPATGPTVEHGRDESDDHSGTRSGHKKNRSQRIKDKSERNERERQRQEASSKRKNRAERRRVDDSELSEEHPLPPEKPLAPKLTEPLSASDPAAAAAAGASRTPPPATAAVGSSHKRTTKINHKKSRGRNQYTKDRDEHEGSPTRTISLDLNRTAEETSVAPQKSPSSDPRHNSKVKAAAASRLSMLDMKRRVAAIMEFISRTQVDLAAEATCYASSSSSEASPLKIFQANNGYLNNSQNSHDFDISVSGSSGEKEFQELSCIEMMDVLTRDMVKWQNHYT